MDIPTTEYRFQDHEGAHELVQKLLKEGRQGFRLVDDQHNIDLLAGGIRELGGYFNPITVQCVINASTSQFHWVDTRKVLSDGSTPLPDDASQFEQRNATPAQLRDFIRRQKQAPQDDKAYSWQLPIHATREEVLVASSKQISDWALRRRKAGLPDAV
jgi:hypothetical protein